MNGGDSVQTGDYRDSHTAAGKGVEYEAQFRDNRHRAMVWTIERRVLDNVVARRFADRSFRLLDFACGTGRILAHLEEHASEATGVDISNEMLAVARRRVRHATLIAGDLTREDLLPNRRFDLITAFRFFPNAQPELRVEALAALVRHLADGGVVVLNNHRNAGNLRDRVASLVHRAPPVHQMSHAEVVSLVGRCGLRIEQAHRIAFLPLSERHMPFPGLAGAVERFLTRADPSVLRGIAQNVIYVCDRA